MKLLEFLIANKDNVVFCLAILSLIIPIFIKYKRKLTIILAIISCIYIYNTYQNFDSKTDKIAENTTGIVNKAKKQVSETVNNISEKGSNLLDKNNENFDKRKKEKQKESRIGTLNSEAVIDNTNESDNLKATTESTTETTDIEFENELAEYYNNLDNFKTYQNQNEIKTDDDERANTSLADLENEKY
ncbi:MULTISPECIES: hypothetical protein [Enterococcus]|uniref:Uncharacterized protein n=1 Tax=Enterococcus gilvus ATCC BAA-350 TaxID=1158614 RepID=R2XZS0_9ENTE|nr:MULTISPECIES: hypothetical protein [Enterococcus]EOI55522.1 hypothetical protein UKC_02730 [Enterococcus gilvus ATCC BAA-350]EOW81935.1 hypothetical protein I592_01236 [Enterococcus gilvus ATCC BAA-350]OJG41556.1 hypothetical protein RV02_GL000917 [Enterococcus gilvus]